MKKTTRFGLAMAATVLLGGNAMAAPMVFTVDDTQGAQTGGWNNWNNDATLNTTLRNSDEHGTPQVEWLKVYYNTTSNLLTKVEIVLDANNRQLFDSLFINTSYTPGSQWDSWDYFVRDTTNANADGKLYSVSGFSAFANYTLATDSSARKGNPNGINEKLLTNINSTFGPTYAATPQSGDNDWVITYDFTTLADKGLKLNGGFFVAYAPWCANDVVGGGVAMNPVPEPATMLLFGTGIAGLAGIARRRRNS